MGRLYDATWGRAFSALYDRILAGTEEAGMRDMRREVLAAARGRTIDIGAGTGANLGLFPEGLEQVVMAEPDPHMLKRLRPKIAASGAEAELVEAGAESLPFPDGSFDTAVFTLVLCTVPDPAAALAEAARILKPGGKLLFVEHVRSEDPGTARWQDRLERPLEVLRRRLPLQPRHRRRHRGLAADDRPGGARRAPQVPADRQAAGLGPSHPRRLIQRTIMDVM